MAVKYGIKEVADVEFYQVGATMDKNTGAVTGSSVVAFDSLKVSNIEFAEEQSEARGGKGNPVLMLWDHSKDINVTIEDALFTEESLGALLGTDAETVSTTGKKYVVTPTTFAKTYAVHGSTSIRDENGIDHAFDFFIPKAKLVPEQTFTMEADGDPTVFNFNLKVLRDENEVMIQFFSPEFNKQATEEGNA